MKVYEIHLTLAEHDSDIKIKALLFVTRCCAYNGLRYQVSVYRTIGPQIDWIFLILAGNKDNYKVLDEFEIRPDPTIDRGVSCP